jgi:hypothetical protein
MRGCDSTTTCNDGCNTCRCANGEWACTRRFCPDAGPPPKCDEPGKRYVSRDPNQCKVMLFSCPTNSSPFFDDCGCGCISTPPPRDAGPAPTCDAGVDPNKRYVSRDPEQCKLIDYMCPTNTNHFTDACGCGCVSTPPPKDAGPAPICEDPNRRYVSRDPRQCAAIDFICPPDSKMFYDSCGCGCQKVPTDCRDIQCFRAINCVKECGGPVVQSGCCPCPAGTFDDISCRIDAGPSTCDCLRTEFSWGSNGGLVAQQDLSTVIPCQTYAHERQFFRTEQPSLACKTELLGCGADSLGIGDINAALNNSDVQAAIKAAPVVYGRDLRPVDGTVFRITINGKTIDVGSACRAADCKTIPAGVTALMQVLQAIDKQELAKPACSVFSTP